MTTRKAQRSHVPYTDTSDAPEWERMTKRIRKIKEEMEDDDAMGQLPAEKKKAYQEVSLQFGIPAEGRKSKI